jgi:hypothetical protein
MARAARALIAAASILWGGGALAQDAAKFPLELNRLEPDGEVCRVYLKVKNPALEAINEFKLDLVFFDKSEIIRNRLYVELGPLVASKTAVRLFDIPDFQCGALGSILVNDVVACIAASGANLDCLARLELSSKAGISLDY